MAAPVAGLQAIVQMSLLALILGAVGRRCVGRLLPDSDAEERAVLGFPLGMGLLSLLTMVLLFARLPVRGVLLAALLGGALWVKRDWVSAAKASLGWLRRGEGLFRWAVLLCAAFGLVGCLAPETGWDTGVYHFATARLRAEEGWMVVRPDIPHGYRPAAQEMLQTVGFLFQGEVLASLMNFSLYFAGLALACLWGGKLGGPAARVGAGTAYLGLTTFVLRMDGGDVEVGQAVFLGIALYSLWRRREGASFRWIVLAGFSLGLLLGIKYASAWAVIALGSAWGVVRCLDRLSPGRLTLEVSVLALLAGLVGCPWYVRNHLVMGNAFYPFLTQGVAGAAAAGEPAAGGAWAVLDALKTDLFILTGLLCFGVAALRRLRWMALGLLLFVGLLLRQMGFTAPGVANALRYGSPAFLPLSVLGSRALQALAEGRRTWVLPFRLLLLGTFLVGQGIHAARNVPKIPAAAGLISREAYLDSRVNSAWAMRAAGGSLPAGKRVLLVEQRVYYCRVPFLAASDLQQEIVFEGISTGPQLRAFLDRHAIGLIVSNHAPYAKTWGFQNMLARAPRMLADARVTAVETRNDCTLYRVD